ncbi:MAG: hypothetical protein QNK37_16000 [Acidobacteriota bacterium]|nr:hypothetical protein [Acidobacteriota bacterium]
MTVFVFRCLMVVSMLVVLCGCQREAPRKRAFYFWKTVYDLQPDDMASMASLSVDRLYIRFFDIVWDEARQLPKPVGSIEVLPGASIPANLTPVVFITNETMSALDQPGLEELARNTVEQVFHLARPFPDAEITQFQVDCDWTPGSRDNYFYFLRTVRTLLKQRGRDLLLSATVRLHQLRDRETNGIPPVDRGVLMAYHTSSPLEYAPGNSILDLELAAGYLRNAPVYRIPLDPALPVFGWAVQYDANRRFVRLLRQVDAHSFKDTFLWTHAGKDLYRANTDTYLDNRRIMTGDLVELEHQSLDQLEALARLLLPHAAPGGTVLLFDYDKKHIDRITGSRMNRLEVPLAKF